MRTEADAPEHQGEHHAQAEGLLLALVCRAEAELTTFTDAGDPDGDGLAVRDELDWLDPELDIARTNGLPILETDADSGVRCAT